MWSILGSFINACFTPITGIITTRTLGAEIYGVFNIFTNWGNTIADFARIGTGDALLKFIPKYKYNNDRTNLLGVIFHPLVVISILSICAAILIFFNSDLLSITIFHDISYSFYVKYYTISIIFTTIYLHFISVLTGLKSQREVIISRDIIANIVKVIALVLLFLFGMNLGAALISNIFRDFSILLLTTIFLNKYLKIFNFTVKYPEKKTFYKFSFALFGNSIFNKYTFRSDLLFLTFLSTPYEIGIYSVALKLQPFIYMSHSALSQIFAPLTSELYEKKDITNLSIIYKNSTKLTASISIPIFTLLMIFGDSVLSIFGKEFIESKIPFIILSIGSLSVDVFGISGQILNMIGKPQINLINSIITSIITITLFLVLIPMYGIKGAALSYTISLIFINLLRLYQVNLYLHINPFKFSLIKVFFSSFVSSLIIWLLRPDTVNILFLILLSFLWIVIYALILFLLKFDETEILLFKTIKDKIISKNKKD